MPTRRFAINRIGRASLAASAAVLLGLCGPIAAASPTINWPTFGLNNHRNNYNPSETALSASTVTGLKELWHADVGSDTRFQPSLVNHVVTDAGTVNLLLVTLPKGTVAALNAATGAKVWSVSFPPTTLTCAGYSGIAGIGEPATIDVRKGRVFVVDGGGHLHALSVATGAEMSGYPVEVIDAANLAAGTWVHYASPTLVGKTLYLTTAAFQRCETAASPYHGQIIGFDTKSLSVTTRYYPTGSGGESTMLGGGFWGTGGVALDPGGAYLWGATANTLPPPQNSGNAEKIVQLDLNLHPIAINGPTLAAGGDYDFGSTPLLFTPAGCPEMLAAMNKTGIIAIYNATSLTAGPTQIVNITAGGGSGRLIGMPSWDPVTNALYVGNPLDSAGGPYLHGLVALQANKACQFSLLWQQTVGSNGSTSPSVTPVIANGVVYFGEGKNRQLAAFNAATGAPLWSSAALGKTVDAPPIIANGVIYVGVAQDIYAFGLAN
jgi:outer membrane protein assembly factor BamB